MPAPISPASRRIEAPDARADERRRVVWLTAERVQIARSVGGVFMRIDVEPSAYRGVALCLTHFDDEGFHYEVRLVHADPDLNIPLESCVDAALATARWKRWARFFAAPKLVEREPGVFEDWGLTTSGLNDRHRRAAIAAEPAWPAAFAQIAQLRRAAVPLIIPRGRESPKPAAGSPCRC